MINTNQVANAMKKEFGSLFSTDAHKENDIIRYINSALRYIVTQYNFPFNKYSHIITTNGVDTEYSIPYQIETFFVLNQAKQEIDLLPFEEYFRKSDVSDKICAFEDRLICNFSGTFTIFYRGFPPIITSLTDIIQAPEHFFDAVVLAGTYYGFLDIKAYDKANNKKNILEGLLKSLAKRSSDKFPMNIKRMNKGVSNIF